MNKIEYPKWIPNPATADGLPEILVHSEDEYIEKNSADYEKEKTAAALRTMTVEETVKNAVLEERQRCATVAKDSRTLKPSIGAILAQEILLEPAKPKEPKAKKPKPPTLEVVKAAGYGDVAAASIVEQEQAKAEAGEPPYDGVDALLAEVAAQ